MDFCQDYSNCSPGAQNGPAPGVTYFTYSYRENSLNVFSSETTSPIKAKFHMDPQWIRGTEVYSPRLGHMAKMAAMPIYGKNFLQIFFSGTIRPMALGLSMHHSGHGPIKLKEL